MTVGGHMELEPNRWKATVAKAKAKAPRHFHTHIDAADTMMQENPFIWEVPGGLEILSETSGKRYFAGISCQCEAWKRGKPCKHRTAARLVRRYREDTLCR